ncbi:MAG: hypothetical protein IANPNBLG_03791 [Bryobacteraceae bacterium]|nr:hypothetical protein [Bryobacteraceae bacterium]
MKVQLLGRLYRVLGVVLRQVAFLQIAVRRRIVGDRLCSPRSRCRSLGFTWYTFFQSTYNARGLPYRSTHARSVAITAQRLSSLSNRASSIYFPSLPAKTKLIISSANVDSG